MWLNLHAYHTSGPVLLCSVNIDLQLWNALIMSLLQNLTRTRSLQTGRQSHTQVGGYALTPCHKASRLFWNIFLALCLMDFPLVTPFRKSAPGSRAVCRLVFSPARDRGADLRRRQGENSSAPSAPGRAEEPHAPLIWCFIPHVSFSSSAPHLFGEKKLQQLETPGNCQWKFLHWSQGTHKTVRELKL